MAHVIILLITVKEESVAEVKTKLPEYAAKYRNDVGTLGWYVHQDSTTPTKFSVVERFVNEGALTTHRANPAYPTFAPWLKTHLAAPFQIQFFNELDVDVVNQEAKL